MLGVRLLRLARHAPRYSLYHCPIPTTITIHYPHYSSLPVPVSRISAGDTKEELGGIEGVGGVGGMGESWGEPVSPLPMVSLKPTLVVDGNITNFPTGLYSSFSHIRNTPGMLYFDRTGYIPVLDSEDGIMFLRPRRFGKSLTLSMLRHFYGVEYKESYGSLFKGLDVDKHVAANKLKPGEYFVLFFDFSELCRTKNLNMALKYLVGMINTSVERFYEEYATLLGRSAEELVSKKVDTDDPISTLRRCITFVVNILRRVEKGGDKTHPLAGVKGIYLMADEYDAFSSDFIDPHGKSSWEGSDVEAMTKALWATVKGATRYQFGVRKFFITGISPLSLVEVTSGFNIASNLSFIKDLSGLCGLTRADIVATLEQLCGQDGVRVAEHLKYLTKFANGYHFCGNERVELVYNTNTCLEYFQSILKKRVLTLENPVNSEVPGPLLTMCAHSNVAVQDMQAAILREADGAFKRLPYCFNKEGDYLRIDSLRQNRLASWRLAILYHGGFTFDSEHPSKYIRIPNLIAAGRFSTAILDRFSLLESFHAALVTLGKEGDIKPAIAGYQKLMVTRDAGYCSYGKTEDIHRDSMYFGALTCHTLTPSVEFKVMKRSSIPGRVDLIVQSTGHFVLTEWKNINTDFLGNVKNFTKLDIDGVLELKFNKHDKFGRGGKTIRYWVEKHVSKQLRGYVESPDVKQACGDRAFHAHLVLVVGSQHILIWDMDQSGKWIGQPVLANNLMVQAQQPKACIH